MVNNESKEVHPYVRMLAQRSEKLRHERAKRREKFNEGPRFIPSIHGGSGEDSGIPESAAEAYIRKLLDRRSQMTPALTLHQRLLR